jgi:nicotinamidase-related amidase
VEIDPARTAVIALHWQNDILKPDGAFGGFFAPMVEKRQLIPHVADVLRRLRHAGIRVIYVRVCYRQGFPDLIVNNPFFALIKELGALLDGSWGAEIVPELLPQPEDIVVEARRVTGFPGTDLDIVLQASGIRTLLLCGVATNATVEGTAREGVSEGYEVLVLEDCCTAASEEMHEASIATLRLIAGVTTSTEVLEALSSQGGADGAEAD